MSRILLTISEELRAVLDVARRGKPLNPFIERRLRQDDVIKRVAEKEQIEIPERPDDGRGGKAEDDDI